MKKFRVGGEYSYMTSMQKWIEVEAETEDLARELALEQLEDGEGWHPVGETWDIEADGNIKIFHIEELKIEVGDRVRILDWETIQKEHLKEDNSVEEVLMYDGMKKVCGQSFPVAEVNFFHILAGGYWWPYSIVEKE